MARQKTSRQEQPEIIIDACTFRIRSDKSEGVARVVYKFKKKKTEKTDWRDTGKSLKFKMTSGYIDFSNNIISAGLEVDDNNSSHREFRDKIKKCGGQTTGDDYTLLYNNGTLIYRVNEMRARDPDAESSYNNWVKFYPSKSSIVHELLLLCSSEFTIGGARMINFNLITENTMLEFGFRPVEDIFGGPPIWAGDTEKVFEWNAGREKKLKFVKRIRSEVQDAATI